MNIIELSYVIIKYEAPIAYFTFKEGAELGFPEIKELISYAEKLSNGKTYVTFSDVRANMSITEEGNRYVSDMKNMPFFRGTAALVKNSMYSFAANFMNNFSKKPYPFRVFTDKNKATEWLRSLPLD